MNRKACGCWTQSVCREKNYAYVVTFSWCDLPMPWVKIGATSQSLEKRRRQIESSMPLESQIHAIGCFDCRTDAFKFERDLKNRLAADQIRGEWFHRSTDVQAIVRASEAQPAPCGGTVGWEDLIPKDMPTGNEAA